MGELLNKKKDGTLFWESASISPIHNEEGAITHFLAVKEDITEKKNEHVELIKAKEHAEESDRLKSSFLANMSHEIRTPLNSIIGFSNLLNDLDFDEEEKSEFINNIINSGNDLLLIINDIMDLSMIESEQLKIKREHISVNKLLIELENEFKTKASDKGIKLHLTFPLGNHDVVIENDLNRTRQILNNLIGNALKFTSKGFVEIGYSHKGNVLEFYVADSGIGISPDNFQAIFDRFRQVEIATTRNYGGNGLGLSISKKLVEMLGGRIWVESVIGKGSCFYFTLPDNPILQEELTAPSLVLTKNKENQIKSLKILVAEDDEGNSKFLNLAIRQISKKTLNVKNGFEAVEACRNNPDVDLILMDIQMPGMDGYEATRQIRQFNTNVIIIAQTAFALSDDSEKAITAGCNDYISKPIKKEKLMALFEKYFKKQGNFNC